MEGARIVVIEDQPRARDDVREFAEAYGHRVVAEAVDTEGALAMVGQLGRGEVEADVVVLDGNLGPDSEKCDDAKRISCAITEAGIKTPVIGFAIESLAAHGISVEGDSCKDVVKVMEFINSL